MSRTLSRALRGSSARSEEHTSELQSHSDLVCRLLLEKKKHQKFWPPWSKLDIKDGDSLSPALAGGDAAGDRHGIRTVFFFLMIRRPPRSTLSLHDALPISSPASCDETPVCSVTGATWMPAVTSRVTRSEEHTSELQSHSELVCRLLLA